MSEFISQALVRVENISHHQCIVVIQLGGERSLEVAEFQPRVLRFSNGWQPPGRHEKATPQVQTRTRLGRADSLQRSTL